MVVRNLKKTISQSPESRLHSAKEIDAFREEVWKHLSPILFVEWLFEKGQSDTVGHALDVERSPLALYLNDVCSLPYPVRVNWIGIWFSDLPKAHPKETPHKDIYLVGGFGVNSRTPYHMPQELSRFEELVDKDAQHSPYHPNRHAIASRKNVNFADLFPITSVKAINLMYAACPRLRDARFWQLKEPNWAVKTHYRLPACRGRSKGTPWESPSQWLDFAIASSGSYQSLWSILTSLQGVLKDEQVEEALSSEMKEDGFYQESDDSPLNETMLDFVISQGIKPEFMPSSPFLNLASEEVLSQISFSVELEPEDAPVRGNVLASGDDALDKQAEDRVIAELEAGNDWAWCIVTVKAQFGDSEVSDILNGCSYDSEEDFLSSETYQNMRLNSALKLFSPFVDLLS